MYSGLLMFSSMCCNCSIRSIDLISSKYSTRKEMAARRSLIIGCLMRLLGVCHTLNQTYQRRRITFEWEMQSAQNMNVMYIIFYSEGDLQDVDS